MKFCMKYKSLSCEIFKLKARRDFISPDTVDCCSRGLILCEDVSTRIFRNKFINKVLLEYKFKYILLIK